MLIEEILFEFRQEMDKTFSGSYPEIEPIEITTMLNNTVLQLVHNRYGINNVYQKGFEQSQKRTDDLSKLVRTRYFNTTLETFSGYNVYTVNLNYPFRNTGVTISDSNSKYLHYLKGHINATISKLDSCGVSHNYSGETFLRIINQEELNKLLYDPFNKPNPFVCLGLFENDTIKVYTPLGFTVNNICITFLKYPNVCKYDSTNPLITSPTALNTYTYYEVFSGTVTYNSKTYSKGDVFETTTITAFTGSGQVRLFQGIDLPDYFIREIVKETVKNYLEVLESPRLNTIERIVQKEE